MSLEKNERERGELYIVDDKMSRKYQKLDVKNNETKINQFFIHRFFKLHLVMGKNLFVFFLVKVPAGFQL